MTPPTMLSRGRLRSSKRHHRLLVCGAVGIVLFFLILFLFLVLGVHIRWWDCDCTYFKMKRGLKSVKGIDFYIKDGDEGKLAAGKGDVEKAP